MNSQENSESHLNGKRDHIHDLRSPLTGIMGFAELLLEDDSIQGQHREYLEIILKESKNMVRMLEEIPAAAEE